MKDNNQQGSETKNDPLSHRMLYNHAYIVNDMEEQDVSDRVI
jgi:hypothetical protein